MGLGGAAPQVPPRPGVADPPPRPAVVPSLPPAPTPREPGMSTRAEELEVEIDRFGHRMEKILEDYPLGTLKDKSTSTVVLKSIETRVTRAFDILDEIFGGTEITPDLEDRKGPLFLSSKSEVISVPP